MANSSAMMSGHLANSLLHTLADIEKGDELLGISSLLKYGESIDSKSIKHPVGFAVLFVIRGLAEYLIRHVMLRTTGTLVVKSKTQDRRSETTSELSNHGHFGSLHHAIGSRRRLRRDILLGITYNILYLLLTGFLSLISSSLTWTILSHLTIGLLLSNLHLRWTCTILSSKQPLRKRIISLPNRNLILPCTVYILCQQLTAKYPSYIARTISVDKQDNLRGVAVVDAVVLGIVFGLRLLVLYPAFAAYVYSEIKQVDVRTAEESGGDGQKASEGFEFREYGRVTDLCFKRTAVWFGLLHLQMVLVLAVFELLVTPVVHKMIF